MTTKRPKPPLSTWRVNKSEIPVLELANAIRALRKVIGTIDPKAESVEFSRSAQSYNSGAENIIRIDPTFAVKSVPIDPNDFDVLVGHAAHEAGHTLVRSSQVFSTINVPIPVLHPNHNKVTQDLIAVIGEEVYTDHHIQTEFPILHQYLAKSRVAYAPDPSTVNWADIMASWCAISVYGLLPSLKTPPLVLQALGILIKLADTLRTDKACGKPYYRRDLYHIAYTNLQQILQQQAVQRAVSKSTQDQYEDSLTIRQHEFEEATEAYDKDDTPQLPGTQVPTPSTPKPSHNPEGNNDPSPATNPLPPTKPFDKPTMLPHTRAQLASDIWDAVKEALDLETEDISAEIEDILSNDNLSLRGGRTTIYQKSKNPPDPTFDESLYRDLVWIRNLRTSLGRETFRAEPKGLLDRQRLYRVPIDGLAFKVNRRRPYKKLKLVLLLDASGSMNEHKEVYAAAKAIYRVIPKTTILTYNSSGSQVTIEVNGGNHQPFKAVEPGGFTPSGIALLATVTKFPDSYLIHFTDGANNVGPDSSLVFPIIHKDYPAAHIAEVRYPANRKQIDQYRFPYIDYIYLKTIASFPQVLRELVKPWYLGG